MHDCMDAMYVSDYGKKKVELNFSYILMSSQQVYR